MSQVLVVATAGAGGDLQPLIAAALALRTRGHQTRFVGDRTVERALDDLDHEVEVLPDQLDLGPRLGRTIREAMAATGGDLALAGTLVQEGMTAWARETAGPVGRIIERDRPTLVVTSLFGVEVLHLARPDRPWAVVNSTFYVGPDPPRALELDFGPRAVPLVARYASLLGEPDLVLHATDREFDLGFARLPPGHHHTGPLGLWEPAAAPPDWLDQGGDPWVLVSISSQLQDDLPLAEAALQVLAGLPVRVVATLGPGHRPEELSSVPANARVETQVPHSAVLERAALLIGHAGHGTVMKALWQGTPMVLMPWGRDQPGVAERARALGVALVVPRDGGPAALAPAITAALDSQDLRRAADAQGRRLRSTDPPRLAADLLEGLIRPR